MLFTQDILLYAAIQAERDGKARERAVVMDADYEPITEGLGRRERARAYTKRVRVGRFIKRLFTGAVLFFAWALITALLLGAGA